MARILVIDHDTVQQLLTARALQGAGHETLVASESDRGFALIHTERPDVVVSAVVMPGLNGFQLATALRADPAIAHTPLLLLSTLSDRVQMRVGMTSGADDYLSKPYSAQELVDAVAALLRRHAVRADTGRQQHQQAFAAALREPDKTMPASLEVLSAGAVPWLNAVDRHGLLVLSNATVLLTNLFGALGEDSVGSGMLVEMFRAARDSLYKMGAIAVLPYGAEVVAVFDAHQYGTMESGISDAIEAAMALRRAAQTTRGADASDSPLVVALACGEVTIAVLSKRSGDASCTILPGATVAHALALREFARQMGWQVGVYQDALSRSADPSARIGRALLLNGAPVSELLPLEA
ncbi:response regulator transcription factor [Ramlibacter sp.]|uniref:response regulator transcription factor n=1 Tax=Ramlibacter sp. TaxID=1917967 RepID=UPI003D0C988B